MKKLLILLLPIALMIGCNQKKIEQLENRNDSLVQVTNAKDQALNDFIGDFNDMQENLDSIKMKEMMITEKTANKTELKKQAKEQINEDINDIYQLLLDTRKKLENTRDKLGRSNVNVKELETMLTNISKKLEEKDKAIDELRGKLESMNIKITNLTADVTRLSEESAEKSSVIKEQQEMIEEKTSELHTAFYTYGSKKDLREKNIITLEGGFIGIGREERLKNDPNMEYFTKIDMSEALTLAIPGDKSEIVTPHPAGSYSIEGEGKDQKLKITDYQKFWKSSRYLVIITD